MMTQQTQISQAPDALQKQIIERIERYVHAVCKKLSPKLRDEVANELTSHIWDALEGHVGHDQNASLEDIDAVLLSLGSPEVMAKQYGSTGQHLIGPALFDTYKLVVSIAMIGSVVGVTIANLFSPDLWSYNGKFIQSLIQLFAQVFSTGISSFGMVTFIFAIIERSMGSESILPLPTQKENTQWHPSKLPAVPMSAHKIKRSDAITDFITTGVSLIFIIQFLPGLLKISFKDPSGQFVSIPMMSADTLQPYIWIFGGILVIQLALTFYNLITQEWSTHTRVLDSFLSLGFLGVFYVFITDTTIILPNALNSLRLYRPELADLLFKGTSTGMISIFVVISIITFISIGEHVYKGLIKKF